jgi:alpha-glucuronidase
MCASYHRGAAETAAMAATWGSLRDKIDEQRHREVAERLAIQARDAAAWRDRCLGYFQSVNHLPMPPSAQEGASSR